MRKFRSYLFLVILILFSINFANANFENFQDTKKDCLELIKNEYKSLDFSKFSDSKTWTSTNDLITQVDFVKSNIFTKETYNLWNKSQMSRKDIFRIYDLYGIDLSNSFFYDNELNFLDISKDWKNIFLSCGISKNINLKWSLQDLKKWDANTAYTSYPEVYNISSVNFNGKKWKKLVISRNFKNRTWNINTFKIESTFLIPENENLKNYYNLYDIVDTYWDIIKWYKTRIENIPINFPQIKEIYNKNWISFKRYFVWWLEWSDPYWIRYAFVNWINFFNDFAEYRRNYIFEYFLKDNSPLAKEIYILENKWDPITKKYIEPQLDYVSRVLYFLWDLDLPKDKTEVVPYYLREINLASNNYYKVNNQINRKDYMNYFYQHIYSGNTNNNPAQILQNIKDTTIDSKFSDLIKEYNDFKTEYNSIKDSDKSKKQAFANKYWNKFPNDEIFIKDTSLAPLVNPTLSKDMWNENSINDESKNLNILFVAIWIIAVLALILFIKKSKKK